MTKRSGLLAVALLAVPVLSACGDGNGGGGSDEETLKIGISAAFSGDLAYYGQSSQRGAEIAVEELKETMPDLKIEIVTADDECSPGGGASAFRSLINQEVDVVLGSVCSGATLGGMPVLAQSETPGLTVLSSSPEITEQSGTGGNDYMFRLNASDDLIADAYLRYMADEGVTTLAVVTSNNDFGRAGAETYAAKADDYGVEIVATEYYDPGVTDLRPQLTKVKAGNAGAVLTFAEAPECALMLRQMDELGMDQQLYGRGSCVTPDLLTALDSTGDVDLAQGLVEASYWALTPDQEQLMSAFEAADEPKSLLAAMPYYGVLTLAEATEVGGGTTKEAVHKGLKELDWDGPLGPISFDENHQAHPNAYVASVRDGEIQVIQTIDTTQ